MAQQISGLGRIAGELLVKLIRTHVGKGRNAWFEILWESGDLTCLDFESVWHLSAFDAYLEKMGCEGIDRLPHSKGSPPVEVHKHVEMSEIAEYDDSDDGIKMNSMVFTD